jgi:large subunit ribosomal protein L19
MDLIKAIEAPQLKELTDFRIGDTVKVHYKIIEGKNERIQVFEGVCIVCKGSGARKTFTVRKISNGIGVERIFPMYSPKIEKIEVVRQGRVRRGKLYYVRGKVGKNARIKERLPQKEKKSGKAAKAKKEPKTAAESGSAAETREKAAVPDKKETGAKRAAKAKK